MEVALFNYEASKTGTMINVLDLPYKLEEVLKNTFNVDLTEGQKADMVIATSVPDTSGLTFDEFVEKKKDNVSQKARGAGDKFLNNLYQRLEVSNIAQGGRRTEERMSDWPSNMKKRGKIRAH